MTALQPYGCHIKIWFIASKSHTCREKTQGDLTTALNLSVEPLGFGFGACCVLSGVVRSSLFSSGLFFQLVYSLFSCFGLEWAPAGPCLFPAWSRFHKNFSISASELLWRWIHECANTLLQKCWESALFSCTLGKVKVYSHEGGRIPRLWNSTITLIRLELTQGDWGLLEKMINAYQEVAELFITSTRLSICFCHLVFCRWILFEPQMEFRRMDQNVRRGGLCLSFVWRGVLCNITKAPQQIESFPNEQLANSIGFTRFNYA